MADLSKIAESVEKIKDSVDQNSKAFQDGSIGKDTGNITDQTGDRVHFSDALVPDNLKEQVNHNFTEGSEGMGNRLMPDENPADSLEGKKEFYPDVYDDLEEAGYDVTPEEELKGSGHVRPGDGIAEKGDDVVVIESKSPKELKGNSLPSGSGLKDDYLYEDRKNLREGVKNGKLDPDNAKHQLYLKQAEYNAWNVKDGKCDTREGIENLDDKNISVGYSVPQSESKNVEKALRDKGIDDYEFVAGKNGTLTYIYDLPGE